jgi:hypothetical protein
MLADQDGWRIRHPASVGLPICPAEQNAPSSVC